MRRAWGLVLIGLGVALLALAPLIRFVAVPKLAVAPMNLDYRGDPSIASGTVAQVADLPTGTQKTNVPLIAVRRTGADVVAADQVGGNTGVYFSTQVVSLVSDTAGKPYLPVSPERYAFDRTTSVMKAEAGANVNGVPITTDMIGDDTIMPLKFPFFTDKKTYSIFDTSLMKGAPAEFVAEETVQGLSTYHFRQTIPAQQVGVQAGQPLWYQLVQEMWVEPETGQIVNGSSAQKTWLKNADGTDSLVLIDGTLAFTPENVSKSVAQAKENASKVSLLANVVPVVCIVAGLLALLGGVLLLRRKAEPTDVGQRQKAQPEPVA